jgi:hypothetical protein
MIDQYKDSGPVPKAKIETAGSANPIDLRVEKLEAILHKHEGEISFLQREVSRLKSDISQVINSMNAIRRRG